MKDILYIHGMGGGEDSRIPSILKEILPEEIRLTIRTYNFDPELGREQILGWYDEIKPDLVIGESLGALQALRLPNGPKLFVSPSLGAARLLNFFAWLSVIPGITPLLDKIYRPTRPGRQELHFIRKTLRKYPAHSKAALEAPNTNVFAFFGTRDHYRRMGVVSVHKWRKLFGDTYLIYEGTHFMEEEYVRTILLNKIQKILILQNL